MGIHRSSVSRMIKKARNEGIVSIEIKGLNTSKFKLEEYIKTKYQLKKVVIVPKVKHISKEEKDFMLAREAAIQLKQFIQKEQIIGVSWGSTLAKTIEQIKVKRNGYSIFIPIVGGPSYRNSKHHVNTLVYVLSNKFGGKSIFINSSVIQESKQIRDKILQ